ncbi:hypothetical protein GGX14DRAFT_577950 [Mycena pura]|uniref:Uncharacterized protein n=1 Tax=Mycena pura TaxID=153505 RepID=A0AAD6UQP8_9AGAR|nr:hypothetical protein GGX14DRAFT_577950 [Mycena pura]
MPGLVPASRCEQRRRHLCPLRSAFRPLHRTHTRRPLSAPHATPTHPHGVRRTLLQHQLPRNARQSPRQRPPHIASTPAIDPHDPPHPCLSQHSRATLSVVHHTMCPTTRDTHYAGCSIHMPHAQCCSTPLPSAHRHTPPTDVLRVLCPLPCHPCTQRARPTARRVPLGIHRVPCTPRARIVLPATRLPPTHFPLPTALALRFLLYAACRHRRRPRCPPHTSTPSNTRRPRARTLQAPLPVSRSPHAARRRTPAATATRYSLPAGRRDRRFLLHARHSLPAARHSLPAARHSPPPARRLPVAARFPYTANTVHAHAVRRTPKLQLLEDRWPPHDAFVPTCCTRRPHRANLARPRHTSPAAPCTLSAKRWPRRA